MTVIQELQRCYVSVKYRFALLHSVPKQTTWMRKLECWSLCTSPLPLLVSSVWKFFINASATRRLETRWCLNVIFIANKDRDPLPRHLGLFEMYVSSAGGFAGASPPRAGPIDHRAFQRGHGAHDVSFSDLHGGVVLLLNHWHLPQPF